MPQHKLVGLCGSLRAESFNRKLMMAAVQAFDPADFIDGNLRIPLFDEDLEAKGMPPEVEKLATQIKAADAVIIACPEYNKAPPGVLKNALDWLSRGPVKPWADKPVAIISAAGGRAGGERTQFALRLMMVPFQPRLLMGPEVLVGGASDHFDDSGALITDSYVKLVDDLMTALRREIGR